MRTGYKAFGGFLVMMAMVAACSPAADGPASSAPATTARPVTSTTAPPDPTALCNSYLVLLRSGDPEPIRQAVEDESVVDDIEMMLSSDGEFEAISEAALRVEDHVVTRCTERFTAGLTPAPDDATALTRFMDALGAGDREAAEEVAWAHVVAQFPWAAADVGYEVDGSTATADLGTDVVVTCRAQRGSVVSCRFGPG